MSTRGNLCWIINKEMKRTFNHWDSQPSSLGIKLLYFLKRVSIKVLKDVLDNARPYPEIITIKDLHTTDYKGEQDAFVFLEKAYRKYHLHEQVMFVPDIFEDFIYIINFDENHFTIYQENYENLLFNMDLEQIQQLSKKEINKLMHKVQEKADTYNEENYPPLKEFLSKSNNNNNNNNI